jgi:hypothetical protein
VVAEAKFVCSFRGPRSSEKPRAVRLTRVARTRKGIAEHAHLVDVPFHDSTPSDPSCFLQIWEADHFTARYTEIGEAPKATRGNRLVASLPGAIVRSGDKYTFVLLRAPRRVHARNEHHGGILLRVPAADGSQEEHELPLPDYEGVLELMGGLRLIENDPALADARDGKPHQVHNVRATLLHQIAHRGGVHVSIVADYGFAKASSNDKEFRRQADAMISQLPSIWVDDDGDVGFGRYEVSDMNEIAVHVSEVRRACQALLKLPQPPRVGSLGIYAHGVPRGMKLFSGAGAYDSSASLNKANLRAFVDSIVSSLAVTVVIALFACNTGRGGGLKQSGVQTPFRTKKQALAIYGKVPIGEELGADSYAWALCRELMRRGIPNPTIWAHTVPAHTTRNRRLRVFSSIGAADFSSLLYETRHPGHANIQRYVGRTNKDIHLLNLVRLVHLHSALYMPWEWSGAPPASGFLGFDQVAQREASALVKELFDEIMSGDSVEPFDEDDLVLSEDGARILRARAEAKRGVRLSEHFELEDFSDHEGALPLPLDLVRRLQMLRHRTQKDFGIEKVERAGQRLSLTLRASAADRDAISSEAQNMVDERLFFTDVRPLASSELMLLTCPV